MNIEEALKYFGLSEVPTHKELNIIFVKKKATLTTDEEIEVCMEALDVLQDAKMTKSAAKSVLLNGKNVQLQSLRQQALPVKDTYPTYTLDGILIKTKDQPVDILQFEEANHEVYAIAAPCGLKKGDIVVAQTLQGPRRISIEGVTNA